MKPNSIANIEHCFGCGVCVSACPHHVLELTLDVNGFYSPEMVSKEACVDCGICRNVCSYLDSQLSVNQSVIKWKAMWSTNREVRSHCSSGGVAFELAAKAIDLGYSVIGVKYNTLLHRAEHCICSTIEELKSTRGSKYMQSYTPDSFSKIEKNKQYVVIGTPCQIDSLRRLIKRRKIEDNFILVDFFCHGVPSYWVWKKYINENFKNVNLKSVDFRTKYNYRANEDLSWSDSFCVTGCDENGAFVQPNLGKRDWFYYYFLSDLCLGKACYSDCKYKMYKSAADIRIGDAWGSAYKNNKEGVSAVLIYSEKGNDLLDMCDKLESEIIEMGELCNGQMTQSPEMPSYYKTRLRLLRYTPLGLKLVNRTINFLKRINKILKH